MKETEARRLLHRAADHIPDPEVAETAWRRGRTVRRRRHTAQLLGGLCAATVAVVAMTLGPGLPGGGLVAGPGGPEAERFWLPVPSARQTSPDPALDPAQLGELGLLRDGATPIPEAAVPLVDRARGVWATSYRACMEERGYAVANHGRSLWVSRAGTVRGGYERDRRECQTELRMDAPTIVGEGDTVSAVERREVVLHLRHYVDVNGCLAGQGLPVEDPMDEDEFVVGMAWAQTPPWHPYLAAIRADRYAEARTGCPITGG